MGQSVEKWRASLNGGRFSSFKTAELGHFVDHAFSPLPSPRSASPQSLSGRGNDNHYFFVSATAHRNGGSKVVKEVSSAFSKIHALCIFTVYRRYPRPLLGTALRANTLYTRHNSQLFSIVRTGICGNGFSLWFFLREFFNISYNLLKGTIDRNIVLLIRVSFFLFLNLTKDEGRLRKILLYYNMTCNSCNVIMTRNINSIKSLKTFYVIYVHM